MKAKQLIEKLEDLATFFTLAASNAGEEAKKTEKKGDLGDSYFHEGEAATNKIAFEKVDKLIKEAKK